MANKAFEIGDGLTVTIYKRKASRNLRLSIASDGKVRVSIPNWAPYRVGVEFARARQGWIRDQARVPRLLTDGQAIGKAHRLVMLSSENGKSSSRVHGSTVTVRYPVGQTATDPGVQKLASQAGERALRLQAEQLLPQRLSVLAKQHDFTYRGVQIKRLKSRWGSCDHQKQIVLNLFLMQLPWELIDYVLLHELTHTKVLRHGSDFWEAMNEVLPNTKLLRKQLQAYQPILAGLA